MNMEKRQKIGCLSCLRCENTIYLLKDMYLSGSVCAQDFCLECTNISNTLYNLLQDGGNLYGQVIVGNLTFRP